MCLSVHVKNGIHVVPELHYVDFNYFFRSNPENSVSGSLPIEEPGKYIILWSGKFPFTVSIY